MEPMHVTSSIVNFRKEISQGLSIVKANSNTYKKTFSKKCVHRTETGFCKRSNKPCPFYS